MLPRNILFQFSGASGRQSGLVKETLQYPTILLGRIFVEPTYSYEGSNS